jgi:hypothetical protein
VGGAALHSRLAPRSNSAKERKKERKIKKVRKLEEDGE